MRYRNLGLTLICAFGLSGCAAQIVQASQNACAGYGFTVGTDAYAQCVQQEVACRDAAINEAFVRAGAAMQQPVQQPYQQPQPVGGGTAQGVAFLKGSYVSGMNRVCLYNRLGSAVAITIGATQLCPLTLQ